MMQKTRQNTQKFANASTTEVSLLKLELSQKEHT